MLAAAAWTVRSLAPHSRRCHRRYTGRPTTTAFSAQDRPAAARCILSPSSECEWTTDKVRRTFVEFFASKEHTIQPSSACAPLNDPTLLFTNAGMNQFKPIFLGQVDPNSPMALLKRACNSQKCIRAGGKHNDLEDVGRDTYHHTFFEMLGSWSFGNYFKPDAIAYAWELLVDVYQLDPDRLYATYFEGDESVAADLEARRCWLQYLPAERVLACAARDNFWEMGDTGPCGPCTEIHYDRIGARDAAALVNADDPDVMEIWNLVFIQYNRVEDTADAKLPPPAADAERRRLLQPLPAQHVDTGMGLERLVSILQGKTSNYDIDCFQPLLAKLAEHSTVGPYTGKVEGDSTHPNKDDRDEKAAILKDTAYRAIVDHARTLAFAMADGVVPNNEGRGYVLRRILRRATRYGNQILGAPPGFLATLIPVVVDVFGPTYPELIQSQAQILEMVRDEEQSFSTMLDRGIKFFAEVNEEMKKANQTELPGEQAFFMYDTLGFPIDLTELMATEAGLTVDTRGFANAMAVQKHRSRQAQKAARRSNHGSDIAPALELVAEQTAALKDQGVHPTDDGFKYKWDVALPATVMSIFSATGFLEQGAAAEKDEFVGLVLDKSSFYAEGGGQETDTGSMEIMDADGTVTGMFTVTDVQVYGGFVLHKGVVQEGMVSVGTHVNCKVDYERRRLVAPNHSMTHVLNAALRQVLGDGVEQRGSLCNEEKLRFDFSHKKAMTADELQKVEEICQKVVEGAEIVKSEMMPLDEAKKIEGVRAVFGEVYPDPVRVIRIGDDTSVEFCGGTHIGSTVEAEAFALVEETAVAKGIRRITAVTKGAAVEALNGGKKFRLFVEEAEKLSADAVDLDKQAGAIRKDLDAAFISASLKATLRSRLEEIQKKASDAKKKALQKRVDSCLNDVKQAVLESVAQKKQALVLNVDIGADTKASQTISNAVKDLAPELAFLGLSEEETGSGGKIMAFASVPNSLVESGLKADEWVRVALESCGGRGGGKPGNAQGQAQECNDVSAVFAAANAFAEMKVKANVA